MKVIFGIYLALSFSALFAYSLNLNLSQEELQQQIQNALVNHPTVAGKIIVFLQQNGVDLQQLASGNTSALLNPQFLLHFKDFMQSNPDVLQFISSLGLNLPKVDWSSILSTATQYLPIIIQVVTAIGKRDLSEQEIEVIASELARFDWNQLLNLAIQNLPTIINVIGSLGKRDLAQDLLTNALQLASQYGISLQTVLQAVQAVQSGNFSALLSLLPANLVSQVTTLVQQLLSNQNLTNLLSNLPQLLANLGIGKRELSRDLLSSVLQLVSQSGVNLQTILQAVQAVQSGNFSALLSLLPAELVSQVTALAQQLLSNPLVLALLNSLAGIGK